jgi:hypothetical protein
MPVFRLRRNRARPQRGAQGSGPGTAEDLRLGAQELQTGEQTAAIPLGYPEGSWQFVDAIARLETGGNVKDSKPVGPYVIWSKELDNVPEDPKNPPVNPNYQAEFKKLWGIK